MVGSIANLKPSKHARERRKSGAGRETVNNDLVWLRIILRCARAAWGLPFDLDIVGDACEVVKAEKLVAKSKQRLRRPATPAKCAKAQTGPVRWTHSLQNRAIRKAFSGCAWLPAISRGNSFCKPCPLRLVPTA